MKFTKFEILVIVALIAFFVIAGYAVLSGNTTVLDLYNATGELFQSL